MAEITLAAVAAHFGRDISRAMPKIAGIIADARAQGVDLLVFPDATLGGYLASLASPDPSELPPPVEIDGPEIRQIIEWAGDMVVCLAFTEEVRVADAAPPGGGPGATGGGPGATGGGPGAPDARQRFNTSVCLDSTGVLGVHRKVHQPLGESLVYDHGDSFTAFDTPVGRLGMLIDYDKTFPEAARSLALDGAEIIACLSAWPASTTNRAERLPQDRQSRLFDLYDCARAAENQLFLVSSNQTGVMGGLRFLGQAKVVGPGGDVLAKTWNKGALAVARIDVQHEVARARRRLHHLHERATTAYHPGIVGRA
ncbi:carbon-nitrogen hydrolase family protein [Subtercola boreus]|uniref:Carbon-nitrogen hydrolase family protein n=1 Tax=Subtercola boreus TaxID=120213 RepID=A0A3E0WCM4_9MICO|nr:carbon-nitrogen hydrolase family protein [Subtercola boreus]RFA21059.1 carbon-nitrogen hydrolase family protein [Subtercola boreus]RFA21443.1 carbon-nitrogen hydrolase family protein [Subtercola boreus]RFA27414.1 carbon-nitrogen hydrolase family protein [Subtercola boreus]